MTIPRHNTNLFKRNFQYSSPQLRNILSHNLRTATGLPSFKHKFYSFIVSKRCYSYIANILVFDSLTLWIEIDFCLYECLVYIALYICS